MSRIEEFDNLLNRFCKSVKGFENKTDISPDSLRYALRILHVKALWEIESLQKLKRCDNCGNGPMRKCLYWYDCIRGANIEAEDDMWVIEGAETDCGTITEEWI